MAAWLLVMSEDNWEKCAHSKLLGLGLKAQQRVEKLKHGDRIWIYVNKKYVAHQTPRIRRIRGLITITGEPTMVKKPSWLPRGDQDFRLALPFKLETACDFPAEDLLKRMSFAHGAGALSSALLNAPVQLQSRDDEMLSSALKGARAG